MHTASFYGLQPKWTSWDRLYKLFVLPKGLAGAYVAGQVYDETSGRIQLVRPAGLLGPLMALWVKRIVQRRAEREERYNRILPGSPEFLAADPRNFVLPVDVVERATISCRRSLWVMGTNKGGSVELALYSGTRLRFLLVNDQDPVQAAGLLVELLGPSRVSIDW
jgi:hypothetical protein